MQYQKKLNAKKLKVKSNIGWIDPYKWEFVKGIKVEIPRIRKELETMTREQNMIVHKLGFGPQNWLSKELNLRTISKPVENWIKEGGFHSDQVGYDSRKNGEWQTLPIFKADEQDKQCLELRDNMPITAHIISKIPNLWFAAFFKQPPGAEIAFHKHTPNRRIFHFLLNSLEEGNAWIQVGDTKRYLRNEGDCVAFDVRTVHRSGNNSKSERVNLVLDMEL